MSTNGDEKELHAVIGNAHDFWLWSSKTGFDLTHPATPDSAPITPRVTLQTANSPITVDPAKTALVIIDMQNFFLSPALGRTKGAGHAAADQLIEHAIPACRKAGIRVIWVNWGLKEEDLEKLPASVARGFGFELALDRDGVSAAIEKYSSGNEKQKTTEYWMMIGKDLGLVQDPESGKEIEAGKMLMRDEWNTNLFPPLDASYQKGIELPHRPDVWVHKDRMSAMWGTGTDLEVFLQKEGLQTLLFAGVNTDQCVGGTLQDCYFKGYDCVLLSDGSGTVSPKYAQQGIEFNAARPWGFAATCTQLAEGVAQMDETK